MTSDLRWRPIAELPRDPQAMVLARTDDGRVMVWRVGILRGGKHDDTRRVPNHLQFPATCFILIDDLLRLPR